MSCDDRDYAEEEFNRQLLYPADETDEPECEGHPAGPFDPMGETVYCDGTCRS